MKVSEIAAACGVEHATFRGWIWRGYVRTPASEGQGIAVEITGADLGKAFAVAYMVRAGYRVGVASDIIYRLDA